VRIAPETFAVNAHQVAASVVIDHGLPRLALLGAAQEQTAVRAEVVFHLQLHLEVRILLVRNDDAAVARSILGTDNRAILDHPFPAGFMVARAAVPRLRADMPARERGAVEDGDETGFVGLRGSGERHRDSENGDEANLHSARVDTEVSSARGVKLDFRSSFSSALRFIPWMANWSG